MKKGLKANIAINDDYASAYISDDKYNDLISFYYGYEKTFCPKHKTEEECWDVDCDEREWCFKFEEKGNSIVYKSSTLEKFSPSIKRGGPQRYLLAAMLKMVDDGILEFNKGKAAAKIFKGEIDE